MKEKQLGVLLEKMLKQQAEMFLEEEKETQGVCTFDVCFLIVDTGGRTKACLVQKNRRDEDDDWKFKYQSKYLLKTESREIVMSDNLEEFFCS